MMKQKQNSRTSLAILLVRFVVIGLAATGIWFFGSGLWIVAKAQLSQVLLERSFVHSIAAGKPQKPWRWADMVPMARLTSDRLQTSSIVLSGASGQSLAFGPGHLTETPMPGNPGTSVLAGHRDTHFRWIKDLKPGDEIGLQLLDGSHRKFSIRRAWIAPFDQSGIDAEANGNLLALTTCYPFDAIEHGDQRYIVEAELISELASDDVSLASAADSKF